MYRNRAKALPKRCWESHPALKIEVEGKTYLVYGGSATTHDGGDANIYVSLDSGAYNTHRRFPWRNGHDIHFPIKDMSTPRPEEQQDFNDMIGWLSKEITAGQQVFIGCIGGHGRTGLVLAALVKHMTGKSDAIQYVRDHYCAKAVESSQQIDWLHKHYGITKRNAVKTPYYSSYSSYSSSKDVVSLGSGSDSWGWEVPSKAVVIKPMKVKTVIHGENV